MSDIRAPDNKPKQKSRRNKKRRTEDFSSDSSSSSSSSSEDEQQEVEIEETNLLPPDPVGALDEIKASVSARLKQIPFTEDSSIKTETIKQQELVSQHSKDRDELDKTFLQLMTQQFGNDLDELRKKPDFSNESLTVLAQTLQSGSNLFDADEINELVNNTK